MGALIVDHTASGGKKIEHDTAPCVHCQAIVRVGPGAPLHDVCMRCAGPVCENAACRTSCHPFQKKVDGWLKQNERKRAGRWGL